MNPDINPRILDIVFFLLSMLWAVFLLGILCSGYPVTFGVLLLLASYSLYRVADLPVWMTMTTCAPRWLRVC